MSQREKTSDDDVFAAFDFREILQLADAASHDDSAQQNLPSAASEQDIVPHTSEPQQLESLPPLHEVYTISGTHRIGQHVAGTENEQTVSLNTEEATMSVAQSEMSHAEQSAPSASSSRSERKTRKPKVEGAPEDCDLLFLLNAYGNCPPHLRLDLDTIVARWSRPSGHKVKSRGDFNFFHYRLIAAVKASLGLGTRMNNKLPRKEFDCVKSHVQELKNGTLLLSPPAQYHPDMNAMQRFRQQADEPNPYTRTHLLQTPFDAEKQNLYYAGPEWRIDTDAGCVARGLPAANAPPDFARERKYVAFLTVYFINYGQMPGFAGKVALENRLSTTSAAARSSCRFLSGGHG